MPIIGMLIIGFMPVGMEGADVVGIGLVAAMRVLRFWV
jgi:hypothetical protein